MEIKHGFTNIKGEYYPNIREIAYTKEDLCGNLGKLVASTYKEDDSFFDRDSFEFDDRGVYIYKSKYDEKKALRIYKSFADYKFNGEDDEKITQLLQERQNNIILTEFPTGVVTKDGYILGQEIPYYENYKTLYKYVEEIESVSELLELYYKCAIILEELYKNGIIYTDVHPKNFMVNNNDVKLIDFEYKQVLFDEPNKLINMLYNLSFLINLVNTKLDISPRFDYSKTFDEFYENLEVLKRKIK